MFFATTNCLFIRPIFIFRECKVNNFLSKKRPCHIFINKKTGLTIDNLKKNV